MRIKSLLLAIAIILFSEVELYAKSPKYIFYFIGDGMGIEAVNSTSYFQAYNDGKEGNAQMNMTAMPFFGIATTFCKGRYITDSAAAGTALASGEKTSAGTIGMDEKHERKIESIAVDAKKKGMKIGIITSVSADHATPAAFYAHQPSRSMTYEIALDGISKGFDLYASSGYIKKEDEILKAYKNAGYTIMRGKEELAELPISTKPTVVTERDAADNESLAYAIDQKEEDISFELLTKQSIEYLKNIDTDKKGFFLMAEGGKIDWAAHSNDFATLVHEVISLDKAIGYALDFYRKYPKETLIIVTADHSTGGLAIGNNYKGYDNALDYVKHQNISVERLGTAINKTSSWAEVKNILSEKLGLWSKINLKDKEYLELEEAYNKKPSSVASMAINLINKQAGIGWTTGSHNGTPVPIFAIGAGAEGLAGIKDNTDIPKYIRTLIVK